MAGGDEELRSATGETSFCGQDGAGSTAEAVHHPGLSKSRVGKEVPLLDSRSQSAEKGSGDAVPKLRSASE
jgi:hypothetical protein